MGVKVRDGVRESISEEVITSTKVRLRNTVS